MGGGGYNNMYGGEHVTHFAQNAKYMVGGGVADVINQSWLSDLNKKFKRYMQENKNNIRHIDVKQQFDDIYRQYENAIKENLILAEQIDMMENLKKFLVKSSALSMSDWTNKATNLQQLESSMVNEAATNSAFNNVNYFPTPVAKDAGKLAKLNEVTAKLNDLIKSARDQARNSNRTIADILSNDPIVKKIAQLVKDATGPRVSQQPLSQPLTLGFSP
jgi:ERCC4-related helicase